MINPSKGSPEASIKNNSIYDTEIVYIVVVCLKPSDYGGVTIEIHLKIYRKPLSSMDMERERVISMMMTPQFYFSSNSAKILRVLMRSKIYIYIIQPRWKCCW